MVVNERDEIGSDLVPDYMTSVKDGGFYGWPYSYFGQHVDERVEAAAPRRLSRSPSCAQPSKEKADAMALFGDRIGCACPRHPAPCFGAGSAQADPATFNSTELIDSGHQFFGAISRGLALTIQEAVKRWGEPNGYILGQEASGAFIGGLRYGEGTVYFRNVGEQPVFLAGAVGRLRLRG